MVRASPYHCCRHLEAHCLRATHRRISSSNSRMTRTVHLRGVAMPWYRPRANWAFTSYQGRASQSSRAHQSADVVIDGLVPERFFNRVFRVIHNGLGVARPTLTLPPARQIATASCWTTSLRRADGGTVHIFFRWAHVHQVPHGVPALPAWTNDFLCRRSHFFGSASLCCFKSDGEPSLVHTRRSSSTRSQ